MSNLFRNFVAKFVCVMNRTEALSNCRFFHGEEGYIEPTNLRNWWHSYFWTAEKDFVDGDFDENQEILEVFAHSKYSKMRTNNIPTPLLAQLYGVYIHLHQDERIDFAEHFIPYYLTSDLKVLPEKVRFAISGSQY